MQRQRFFSFLLSHHYPEEYHRCYTIGPLHLCSRCSGLYPFMLFFLILQFNISFPQWFEPLSLFLLPIPAFTDWIYGQLFNPNGSRVIHSITGALLGISLSRVFYLYFLDPFNWISLSTFGIYIIIVAITLILKHLLGDWS